MFLKLLGAFFPPFCKVFQIRIFKSKCKKNQQIFFSCFLSESFITDTHELFIGKRCCRAQYDLLSHPLTRHKIWFSSKGGNLLLSYFRDNASNEKGHLNTGRYAMSLCQRYIRRRFGDAGENKVAFLVGHCVSIPILLQLTLE